MFTKAVYFFTLSEPRCYSHLLVQGWMGVGLNLACDRCRLWAKLEEAESLAQGESFDPDGNPTPTKPGPCNTAGSCENMFMGVMCVNEAEDIAYVCGGFRRNRGFGGGGVGRDQSPSS